MSEFLNAPAFPYCKGCGHHLIARNTVKALEQMDVSPLGVVLVTDIGCHGIVDRVFTTHTVHGLHGRAVALGAGIAMGLSSKPVIVFQGDGGATIGLQHLLEAARLNVNMTLVLHNNMLYGMTGGQPSGMTPCGFCTIIEPEGCSLQSYDMCKLTHDAGAAHVSRVLGQGDFSEAIKEAIETEGFSLIEVLELCPSYGIKLNPDLRLKELAKQAGYEPGLWTNKTRPPFQTCERYDTPSLLDREGIEVRTSSPLERRMSMVLGGSAGEGVQLAAEILAESAVASGLQATKKGIYPVTVGVGFSTAEIILSRTPILSYDIPQPDAIIITSQDGLGHNLKRIEEMKEGTVWLDKSLEPPQTGAEIRVRDFRERAGGRNAILYALLVVARETGVVRPEVVAETLKKGPAGKHFPSELLEGGSN